MLFIEVELESGIEDQSSSLESSDQLIEEVLNVMFIMQIFVKFYDVILGVMLCEYKKIKLFTQIMKY